ncbi:hypothetical protein P154DRAFT_582231 [Amniculicola lignicola CBS 123094]|uniref:Uncharacterized protein n=1 Tax=Amniculicola lignicola CBS 123094 TaxID=1392246 RepID=A0A6A5VZA0_9PLEO|nr:hypothetical protein P154DRAFT_582231 [Amniculicola lignicola CBS 123094]
MLRGAWGGCRGGSASGAKDARRSGRRLERSRWVVLGGRDTADNGDRNTIAGRLRRAPESEADGDGSRHGETDQTEEEEKKKKKKKKAAGSAHEETLAVRADGRFSTFGQQRLARKQGIRSTTSHVMIVDVWRCGVWRHRPGPRRAVERVAHAAAVPSRQSQPSLPSRAKSGCMGMGIAAAWK